MSDEIDAQVCNQTWDLVHPSLAPNLVGCKWIFKLKFLLDGFLDRFKARLVAKGFNQRLGVAFHEMFSPMVKPPTIFVVLSVAVCKDWLLYQLDVNNAFLQGSLKNEVFMEQLAGFIDKDKLHYVCQVKKAIYDSRKLHACGT